MSSPKIEVSTQSERTIQSVRSSASELLVTFRSKLDELRGNEEISEFLLRQGFDARTCFEEAQSFLGSHHVEYLAIDGTKFEDSRLDMSVFFAGAYGYLGDLNFNENAVVAESPKPSQDSYSLSTAVPVSEEYSSIVNSEHTEGGEIDPERVSSALMRLSEYFLAFNSMKNNPKIKVILFDRTVSGDIAHISWKMREYISEGRSVLEGRKTSSGVISKSDLELGRMLIENPLLKIPAPRSQLLKFAILDRVIEKGPATIGEILEELGANMQREKGIRRLFSDSKALEGSFVFEKNAKGELLLKAPENTKIFRERLREGALEIAKQIFSAGNNHPLKLGERWITSEDVDYVTLIIVSEILREAWTRNVLIIGIVKDSAANEFVRTVTKILATSRLLKLSKEIPRFESDRMMLQANSLVNGITLQTPWRTFEYDVCFRTISPQDRSAAEGQCDVAGAFKNVIAPERMFVKAYFQLWSSTDDRSVRSHVFLYDRPCYAKYDSPDTSELILTHKDVVEETVVPTIHFKKDASISHLVMGILCSMGSEPIPEALGHNYPLFLADKRSKIAEKEARITCSAAVDLEISKSKLDQQALYERRFRDYRAQAEYSRRASR